MATTTATTHTNGRAASVGARPPVDRPQATGRRRQLPLVVLGVLLVVGCALGFADASLRTGHGEEVLVVAQPVAAGQVLSASDLRDVKLSASGGVATVPASDEQSLLGQPAATALSPGALIIRADVGTGALVASGSNVVAVALKPGSYPPDLAPGDHVVVVAVSSSSQAGSGSPTTTSTAPLRATVLAVQPPSAASGAPAILSLEVGRSEAAEVASLAAAGQVALVQEGAGG